MAASFRLDFRPKYFEDNNYSGNRFSVLCTQVENHLNNTSTIYWQLGYEYHDDNPTSIDTGPTTLTINGQVVYSCSRQSASSGKFPSTTVGSGVSGTIIVEHNQDGTKTIPVSFSTAVYYTTIETVSGNWTLNSIDKVSKVTQNPAEIGDKAVCVINADSQLYRHTVTYQFGTLTGTVVSDVPGGSYTWTFPEAFYAQIADTELSKTGTLTCTTYLNGVATGTSTCEFVATVDKGMPPLLTVTCEDTDTTTLALTGNKNKMIPGFSDISYAITATARNGASVASYSASNGSITLTTATGAFGNTKASSFSFYATDTRGLVGSYTVIMPTVANYYGPSVKITDIDFGSDGKMTFNISGMWWDDNFGAKNNSVTAAFRYKVVDGSWGGWTNSPITDDNSGKYANGAQITGLNYKNRYVIQARIVDKLQTVMTPEIIVNVNPVFDWSETDFNFNVPVNFGAGVSGLKAEDIDGAGLRYGTCNSGSSTTAKVVASPGFTLFTGASIRVYFGSSNTATAPTLNVNSTGAKTIKASAGSMAYKWYSGSVLDFVYDGTYWIMVDGAVATTSYYGKTILSDTDNGDTDKAVTPYGVEQAIAALSGGGSTDVKVGTWTPSFYRGPGSGSGWYIKVGKYVVVGFNLYGTSSSSYTSYEVKVSGLPFTPTYQSPGPGGGGYLSGYTGGSSTATFSGWKIDGSYIVAQAIAGGNYGSNVTETTMTVKYPSSGTVEAGGTILYQTNS